MESVLLLSIFLADGRTLVETNKGERIADQRNLGRGLRLDIEKKY